MLPKHATARCSKRNSRPRVYNLFTRTKALSTSRILFDDLASSVSRNGGRPMSDDAPERETTVLSTRDEQREQRDLSDDDTDIIIATGSHVPVSVAVAVGHGSSSAPGRRTAFEGV